MNIFLQILPFKSALKTPFSSLGILHTAFSASECLFHLGQHNGLPSRKFPCFQRWGACTSLKFRLLLLNLLPQCSLFCLFFFPLHLYLICSSRSCPSFCLSLIFPLTCTSSCSIFPLRSSNSASRRTSALDTICYSASFMSAARRRRALVDGRSRVGNVMWSKASAMLGCRSWIARAGEPDMQIEGGERRERERVTDSCRNECEMNFTWLWEGNL